MDVDNGWSLGRRSLACLAEEGLHCFPSLKVDEDGGLSVVQSALCVRFELIMNGVRVQ